MKRVQKEIKKQSTYNKFLLSFSNRFAILGIFSFVKNFWNFQLDGSNVIIGFLINYLLPESMV